MNCKKIVSISVFTMTTVLTQAGGILTNTNQNIAFNRMMSREGSIAIDGVYYNPAGVAFLKDGAHISLNWQLAFQTRKIDNSFPLFANNVNNTSTERNFKGHALAPAIPSIQFAYNWKGYSFQANLAVVGGGGKCEFDNGLGSFEKLVGETAMGVCKLAQGIDAVTYAMHGVNPGLSSASKFGNTGQYSYESYMRGRQYYYGLSLGVGKKINDNLAVFAGVRGIYALSNYYGYVENIKVGQVPLYTMVDPSRTESANIELNCDQSGVGFTPILGMDYKSGRWNFAAKYEFKTKMRLKSISVNQLPSIGNLPARLLEGGIPGDVIGSAAITTALGQLKSQFDTKMEEAVGEYKDGAKVPCDIPALLAVGVGYNPVNPLHINVGFHYYWDRQATAYNHREDKLKRGTMEWNAGAEYDVNEKLTVSAGWQNTSYGLSDEYMDDKSFTVSSNSIAAGICYHISKKMSLNVAYFCTLYGHKKVSQAEQLSADTSVSYFSDYTRTNHVFGAGLDIDI